MNKTLKNIVTKSIGAYINLLSHTFPKSATKLAYKFFSEPRVGKLNANSLPAILQQAEREIVQLENYQFPVYLWKGNETKILLVHGWESNASRWEPIFPFLQKSGSTIIALDGPAHGLASGVEFSVPKYADFINEVVLKHKPQIIIGHSIGGSACLYFQHHYTTLSLEKMVLMGAPSDLEVLLENYAKLLGLNTKVIQLLDAYFLKRFNIKTKEFLGKKLASTLSLNGIISHDREDDVVLFSESKKIAEGWEKATFIETKGLGHSMHDKKLYESIYSFLFQKL